MVDLQCKFDPVQGDFSHFLSGKLSAGSRNSSDDGSGAGTPRIWGFRKEDRKINRQSITPSTLGFEKLSTAVR